MCFFSAHLRKSECATVLAIVLLARRAIAALALANADVGMLAPVGNGGPHAFARSLPLGPVPVLSRLPKLPSHALPGSVSQLPVAYRQDRWE